MVPQAKLLLDANTGDIGALTNGATGTSANIDTLGVDYVTIDIAATTQSASTQAGSPSVLKLQECDTTVASSFVDIVGFRGGSATAWWSGASPPASSRPRATPQCSIR